MLTHTDDEHDTQQLVISPQPQVSNDREIIAQGQKCPVMGHQRAAVDEIFEEDNFGKTQGPNHSDPKSEIIKNQKISGGAGSIDEQVLKIIAQIYNAVKNNDVATLTRLLERDGNDFDIFEFRDAQGFTPLSMACFKNAEACFITLLEHAKKRASSDDLKKDRLKAWVDVQNLEGFSALHFASFHGNYKIIYPLVETANADINLLNK